MGYKFNPFTGNLDYFKDQDSPVTIQDNIFWELRELTALEVSNKSLSLDNLPAGPDKVTLDVVGGTSQKPGVDFIVIGDTISWEGLGLEPDLTEGDFLRIGYAI
jgi:hypothetical protein